MKAIQKAVIILLIAVMLCGMTGCRVESWQLSQDNSEIAEISIIYLIQYIEVQGYEELQPVYEVIKVIAKEDYEEFVNEFENLPTYFYLGEIAFYSGCGWNNILVTYKNGEMDLITAFEPRRITYNAEGILYGYGLTSCTSIEIDEFIEKWLNK